MRLIKFSKYFSKLSKIRINEILNTIKRVFNHKKNTSFKTIYFPDLKSIGIGGKFSTTA